MGAPMDRSKRVFMQSGTFEQAFPELVSARLDFVEFDFGTQKRKSVHIIEHDGGLLPCGNDRCFRGGYELDREVRNMIRAGLAEKDIQLSCRGDEGTPKLRRGRSCVRSITGTIKLILKEKTTEP
jgi:hypothetical protein